MSKASLPKSLVSNESNDSAELWSEFYKTAKDQKSFINFVQCLEQKIINDMGSVVNLPKDIKKRLEKEAQDLISSLQNTNMLNEMLKPDNYSLFYVYVCILTKDAPKLKKKKSKQLIQSMQNLFTKFYNSLILQEPDPRLYRNFKLLFIRILELLTEKSEDKNRELICNSCFTLLECAHNLHPIYFELFIEDEEIARISSCSVLNNLLEKDLCYYALKALSKIPLHNKCQNVYKLEGVFQYFANILLKLENSESTYLLSLEKLILLFDVIFKVHENQTKACVIVLEHCWQYFISIFVWVCSRFIEFNSDEPNEDFRKDLRPIGRFFQGVFKLFFKLSYAETRMQSSEIIERLSVLLFNELFAELSSASFLRISPANTLQIQAYALLFLSEICKLSGKKVEEEKRINVMKDAGLIEFLLRKEVFIIDFGDNSLLNLANKAKRNWRIIWAYLSRNKDFIQAMINGIIDATIQNSTDLAYLIRIISWIPELEKDLNSFLRESMKQGLITKFIERIKEILPNLTDHKSSEMIFSLIGQLLSLSSLKDFEDSNLLKSLDNKLMLNNPIHNASCMNLVKKILLLNSSSNHRYYKEIIKKTYENSTLIKYLTILYETFEINSDCIYSFLNCSILLVFKSKINPELMKDSNNIQLLWEIIIKCIRKLFLSEHITNKNMEEIDFNTLAEYLSDERLKNYSNEIAEVCVEEVEFILYGTMSLRNSNKIKIPQAVPLIFQILTTNYNSEKFNLARERITHQFHKEIEIPYLAHYNAFDIILKYFSNSVDLELSEFFEKVISKVIPFHIPPQALSKLLNIIKSTRNRKKKLILMQAIEQAIFNSASKRSMINPTNYFYFTANGYIEHISQTSEGLVIGKVSILTWIRPYSLKNCIFFQMSGSKGLQISLEIIDQRLEVFVGGTRCKSFRELEIDEWTFLSISIRTKKSTLRNKAKISICINENYEDYPLISENKYDGKVFTSLIYGNNFEKTSGFEGKMSALFVMYKTFSELECKEFYKLSIQNNLLLSSSTLRSDEYKIFKDLKKSLIFEWQPNLKEPLWIYKGKSDDKSRRFNGVSIFESIKINGGIKIFLPLIDMEVQVEEEISAVTSIILKIFLYAQSGGIMSQEFIQFAGYVLVSVKLFPQLTESLIKIVTSLKDEKLRSNLLKILLQNESIENIQKSEKVKHLNSLLGYIKGTMECDRENLYVIYRHIRNLSIVDIQLAFESFLPTKMNDKNIEAVSYVLVQMYKDKSFDALEALLNIIPARIEGLVLEKHLEAGIIYLLDQTELPFQKQIIKVLSKDIEKISKYPYENNSEIERYLKIIQFLDHSLPAKNVDPEVIQNIFEVICIESLNKNFKINLLDIITNRIRYAENAHDLLFYTSLIEQHIEKLQPYITQSSFFPDWLINAISNSKNTNELLYLCNSTFLPMDQNLRLNKLKVLVTKVKDDHFLLRLLRKLTEDYCKSRLLLRADSFSEFISIIEDINPDLLLTQEYFEILEILISFGLEHSLLSMYTVSSELSSSKLKIISREFKENSSLKTIISLIFKAIIKNHQFAYLSLLEKILIKNNYFITARSDKKISNEDMIIIEIFYNLCDSYYKDENIWLENYIPKTCVLSKIETFVEGFTELDLRKFTEEKEGLKKTQNSIAYDLDERINYSVTSDASVGKRNLSADMSVKDMMKEVLRPEALYPAQLKKPNWIKYIHNFMHNFFLNTKKKFIKPLLSVSEDQQHHKASFSDYAGKIKSFTKLFDNDWLNNFNETRNLNTLHIGKKYKAYLRNLKRLKIILNSDYGKRFKVRPYFDNKNRYRLTKACRNENTNRTRRMPIARSPEKVFLRSFSMAYFESIIEKSDELCSPLMENNENEESEGEMTMVEEPEVQNDQVANPRIIECERITIKGSYFGSLELHGNHLVYTSEGKLKPEGKYPFSALDYTQLTKECKRIWESSEISEIICRRFMHQHTALEIFLKSGKSYYFNIFSSEVRKELFVSLKKWKDVIVIPVITAKIVKSYTKKWTENKLDNFGYLLALNKLASRSFHDLSQYPIFPWVVKDFTSDKIDINDPNIYRDFKWPIGAQDPVHRAELYSNYKQFQEDDITPFNYGSHYSSGGIVLHFLVRLEPYSTQAKLIQNNTFDVPDRLFISMTNAWNSCTSNNGDVKELIPELFDFPDFLFNTNKNQFGIRQNGQPVNDFEYPPWAKNSYDFIRKHRKLLESQYVTEELHNWIDLIFGYKQTGRDAADNLNIFFSVSYEEDFAKACSDGIDEFTRKGMIEQAYHFGQTPAKLFLKPHVQKKYTAIGKMSIFERYFLKVRMDDEKRIRKSARGIGEQEFKITVRIDEIGRIFALVSTSAYLLAVKWDSKSEKFFLLKIKWESQMELGQRYESTELEGFCIFSSENWLEYQSWKSTLPKIDIKLILDIGQCQFCIWEDKYLVSAFHTDHTFKFHSLKGELKKSVKYHCGLVTCVFSTTKTLFTGSLDSSVISWIGEDLNLKVWNIYLGHSCSIRQVQASEDLQIVLSLSASGTILMHDMRNAECLRKIAEPSASPARVMALSEMGIIAVACMEKELTFIYTINGSSWSDSRPGAEDVWCLQFDKTGEYLLTGSNKSIAFFDVFDGGNGLENLMYQSAENTVLAVCVSKDEESITFAINKENRTVINVLKMQNKSENLSTIKIIQQFA
ncbi:hypothetical protein SteCoe_2697 [Stentor coeruleus]|uniref:BEACH domain-containing protein n=1 Tax=Stentor coeruleus TaxID=5963 RepID=A0A1R2CYZ4_9CILI|nr:hypothetical protein SteCoe_2697 [Stentor coeruleus]